uniref:Uncharacterized protein n=1 Tax=Iconisemion striatum TaxID=60296 RepID=A0A1A7WE17_9TELE
MASEDDDDALLFLIYRHLKVNGYRRAAKALEKHVSQLETSEESSNLHDIYTGWMKLCSLTQKTKDLTKRSIKQEPVDCEDESAETKLITVTDEADNKPLIESQMDDESSSETDAAIETQKETTNGEKFDSSVDEVEEKKEEEMNLEEEPEHPEAPDDDTPAGDPPEAPDDDPPESSYEEKCSIISSSDLEETLEYLQHDSSPTQPEENQEEEMKQDSQAAENVLDVSDGASATTFHSLEDTVFLSTEEEEHTALAAQSISLDLMAGSKAPPPADVENHEEEMPERTEDPADLVALTEDVSIIMNIQNDDGEPAEEETREKAKTPKRKKNKKGTKTPRITDAPWETPLTSKTIHKDNEGDKDTPEKKRKKDMKENNEETAATPSENKIKKKKVKDGVGVEESPGDSTRKKKKNKRKISETTDGNSSMLPSAKKKKRFRTKLSRSKRLRLQKKDRMMKSNNQPEGQNLTGRKKQKQIQEEMAERVEAEQHKVLKRRKKKKIKVEQEECSSKEYQLPKRLTEAVGDDSTPAKKTKKDRKKKKVEPDETPPAVSVKKKTSNKKHN